eukprot:2460209-Prymnesium_polylepis.1
MGRPQACPFASGTSVRSLSLPVAPVRPRSPPFAPVRSRSLPFAPVRSRSLGCSRLYFCRHLRAERMLDRLPHGRRVHQLGDHTRAQLVLEILPEATEAAARVWRRSRQQRGSGGDRGSSE